VAFDERAFIRQVEAAGPDEFAALVRHPAPEEEAALRVHLGDARYRRMHEMALTRGAGARGPSALRGNVILIHGIMGGELSVLRNGSLRDIWAKIFRLVSGGIADLRMAANGRDEATPGCTVESTGIMKKHYGEMLLSLGAQWKVRAFWYDWRRDLDSAASLLAARATEWFGKDSPFHIVAHSMGGLVARTFILRNREWWDGMADADPKLVRGGRLIMLGTPNHGSFAIPQIMTGLEGMVRKLALIDLRHSREDVVDIVNTFPGSYQMLPSPHINAKWATLYDAATYAPFRVSQVHLDGARAHHDALRPIVDGERMVYVAGANQPTLGDVDGTRLLDRGAYQATFKGDGRVPHALGLLDGVPTWYVEEDHGALARNRDVLATIDDLLETGRTRGLMASPPAMRADPQTAMQQLEAREAADEREIEGYLHRTRSSRTLDTPASDYISADERVVEDLLTRGFLSAPDEDDAPPPPRKARTGTARPRLTLSLVSGGIQDAGTDDGDDDLPVDAIAVGHYRDVKPTAAELAVDRAISAALRGKTAGTIAERDLLITQLTERGTIAGGLAQPFIIRDPRVGADSGRIRVIALAGMGTPGSFGAPELAVLVRELAWALGRMGHRHLATVLIGSGNGNLPIPLAIRTWLQGLAAGLVGEPAGRRLDRVTLVEFDPERVLEMDEALTEARALLGDAIQLRYERLSAAARGELAARAREKELNDAQKRVDALRTGRADQRRREKRQVLPSRVTFTQDGRNYRMGAITEQAAIPERDVTLDPALVGQANDELAGERRLEGQLDRGRFLERLLIPRELRSNLTTDAPLVLMLDATTARIHWEMVAQPGPNTGPAPTRPEEYASYFLGTARGLTRQLRSTFAPPPEPPPPPRRVLRVLIVADPAADAHLPGAEEEGIAIARLFESFNRLHQREDNRVEIVRLFGPSEATRTNVLRTIMSESFDVLHYCGHCRYDAKEPARSGWIFTRDEVLSAHELNRIDRIPKFVFSNACESGITPDRSEKRSVDLAPGFAESFFARGVANFVCTAWPVDDLAARVFALELYGRLLGVDPGLQKDAPEEAGRPSILRTGPAWMHEAMHSARLAIMGTPNGLRTWGAYQHYGSPHFRLFDPLSLMTRK
jgi:hypothetical protein